MANVNTINSLESIQKKTIYSRYGENLNRIFKSRSLKSLIYELKNPKRFSHREMYEAPEFQKKKQKGKMEENYTDIFNSVKSYLKREEKKEAQKENEKKKSKEKEKPKIKIGRDILTKHEFKDPFKYNPNYNAISKNVPCVKIILTEREKNEMKKEQENNRNKHLKLMHSKTESGDKKNQILLEITEENNNSRNILPNTKNTELPLITNVPKQKERSITFENYVPNKKDKKINLRNNHAMRFSKYLSRKIGFSDRNIDERNSYLEPYKYLDNKSKVIDFRKMSSRKPRDFLLKNVLENPSFNNYNPKFDLVEKKMAQVDFSPHINRKNSKKYLLKKIWASYEVIPEYQLVNINESS